MQQHLTGAPMERVSMDVLGPLPKGGSDNKFVLLVCDYFTKWVEAFPLPNQEATTIADRFVKEFVCRYGVPRRLFTDQGSNFQSTLFNEVCGLLDIEKSRTTPYHPQSDGLVERMNRTIEAMLSMFVSPGQSDWDEILPYIMMAYRSAVQDTTGYSPNLMMLGREVELPLDIVIGPPDEERELGPVEYVDQMRDQMTTVHDLARDKIKVQSDRQKRNYDLRMNYCKYDRGDFVWLHNPARKVGISPKLFRPWEGPFLVIKRISDVTYRIQKNRKSKMKVVHFDRLKPYRGRALESWVRLDSESVSPTLVYEDRMSEVGATEVVIDSDHHNDIDETILYDCDYPEVGATEVVNDSTHNNDIDETNLFEYDSLPVCDATMSEALGSCDLGSGDSRSKSGSPADEELKGDDNAPRGPGKRRIQKPARYRD